MAFFKSGIDVFLILPVSIGYCEIRMRSNCSSLTGKRYGRKEVSRTHGPGADTAKQINHKNSSFVFRSLLTIMCCFVLFDLKWLLKCCILGGKNINMRPTISSWRTGHCASVMVKPSGHHSVANVTKFKPFISS